MPHRPNYLIKEEVEQGQMVHRLVCLGGISNQSCGELFENKRLALGTNISLDVRTMRNSQTVPELVRKNSSMVICMRGAYVCSQSSCCC